MSNLFVSHSSQDDDCVQELQRALDDCGQVTWTDSRELCGGDPLWSTIQQAIEQAGAFAMVVSPKSLQSKWTGKELRHALEVQKARDKCEKDKYPVITLSLDSTRLGVLEEYSPNHWKSWSCTSRTWASSSKTASAEPRRAPA